MTLVAALISPHPPVLIERIGGEQIAEVTDTIRALQMSLSIVSDLNPDVLIFISPHSRIFRDHFAIETCPTLKGSFKKFGAGELDFTIKNDTEMVAKIIRSCEKYDVPILALDDPNIDGLDWGILVPYWFMGKDLPIVSLSISDLSKEEHFRLGKAIYEASRESEKNIVFVASGDLSHRLSDRSPYGFSDKGQIFDDQVKEIVSGGNLNALLEIDTQVSGTAGECGLRSFITLAGLLAKCKVDSNVLSYEGPFGIGYLVASFVVKDE